MTDRTGPTADDRRVLQGLFSLPPQKYGEIGFRAAERLEAAGLVDLFRGPGWDSGRLRAARLTEAGYAVLARQPESRRNRG